MGRKKGARPVCYSRRGQGGALVSARVHDWSVSRTVADAVLGLGGVLVMRAHVTYWDTSMPIPPPYTRPRDPRTKPLKECQSK